MRREKHIVVKRYARFDDPRITIEVQTRPVTPQTVSTGGQLRSSPRPAVNFPYHYSIDVACITYNNTFAISTPSPVRPLDRHITREAEFPRKNKIRHRHTFEAQFVDADVVEQHEAILPTEVEFATIEPMVTPAWQ